jgi:hypothetical protein
VLDAYAMANSTLCSNLPTGGKSRRGGPTATMLQQCGAHLLKTIEILRPTVIHTQGADTRLTVEALTDRCEWISEQNAVVEIGGVTAICCSLAHPSAGPPKGWQWPSTDYFRNVAAPSLLEARRLALAA